MKIRIKKQQNKDIGLKPLNVFDYLKSLSQEAKDLMDEIEDTDDDINGGQLLFIGSNKEKFNFNTFNKPLNFISAIYNGEISLKEVEFNPGNLEKKIEELKFNYKPKNEKEEEEINGVSMQANELLKYTNKIINAFRNGTFLSEHLKKTDNAAYGYVLEDVKDFIQEIESMSEKINLSLFEDFLELPSPVDFVKKLINTENLDKNKELVAEIKDRISDLKDRIKEMSKKEKKNKSADETLKIIEEILDYNKMAEKTFARASKVDKGKPESKLEESIGKRVKLRRERIAEIEGEEKNINNNLFKEYFTNYQSPSDMYKRLHETEGTTNEDRVYLIKELLNRM